MVKRSHLIIDLQPKVEVILQLMHEHGVGASLTSVAALLRLANINGNTWKSIRNKSYVSIPVQNSIADVAGFSIRDRAWRDSKVAEHQRRAYLNKRYEQYPGFDTVENFASMLEASYEKLGARFKLTGASDLNISDLALIDIRNNPYNDAAGYIKMIVDIDIQAQQDKSGIQYGYRAFELRLSRPAGSRIRFLSVIGDGSVIYNSDDIIIKIRGTQEVIILSITSLSNSIIEFTSKRFSNLIAIADAEDADEFRAELSVSMLDLVVKHPDDALIKSGAAAIAGIMLAKYNSEPDPQTGRKIIALHKISIRREFDE